MSSIHFVTDRQPGEPDIPSGNQLKPLVIRSCADKRELTQVLPSGPWTHKTLVEVGQGLDSMFAPVFSSEGADAYLGDQFVGSTEV